MWPRQTMERKIHLINLKIKKRFNCLADLFFSVFFFCSAIHSTKRQLKGNGNVTE